MLLHISAILHSDGGGSDGGGGDGGGGDGGDGGLMVLEA